MVVPVCGNKVVQLDITGKAVAVIGRHVDNHYNMIAEIKQAIGKVHRSNRALNSNLAHLMKWAIDNGYKPQQGTEIHRRLEAVAVDASDAGTDHAGTRDAPDAPDDRGPDQPTPGACGDPECPVLHADPANPIHPPFYVDSRTREGLQPRDADDAGDGLPQDIVDRGGNPVVGPTIRDWGWLRFQEREAQVMERRQRLGLPTATLSDPATRVVDTPRAVAHRLEQPDGPYPDPLEQDEFR